MCIIYYMTNRTKCPIKLWTQQKRKNCYKQGIPIDLTWQDIAQLMDDAGITVDDIGKGSADYNLARYGDKGGYTLDNCRFITKRENIQERDSSNCGRKKITS